jgi:hypothetical protein
MDTRMIEALVRQPAQQAPVSALRAAVQATWQSFTAEEWDQFREASKLTASVPEIRARAIFEFTRTIDALAGALAQRSGRSADDLPVRVLAGAVIGVIMAVTLPGHALGYADAGSVPQTEMGPESLAAIDEGLALLEAGFPL